MTDCAGRLKRLRAVWLYGSLLAGDKMTSRAHSFCAIGALGGATAFWLAVCAFGDLVLAWVAVINLMMVPLGLEGLLSNAQMSFLTGVNMARLPIVLLHLAVHILCAFWLYRACANAQASGRRLKTSPAWAIGWWFVPVANLWKPYQALAEVWRASGVGESWRSTRVPQLLLIWWGVFWVNRMLEIAPSYVGPLIDPPLGQTLTLIMLLAAALTGMVSCLMFMSIVQGVSALQTRWNQADVF